MKNKMKNTIVAMGAAVALSVPVGAVAQDDGWNFGVTIPLWAPQIEGDVTVRGNTADVDISFDDLKDKLDASFSIGLEARKGKFGLYTGIGYMKFSADGTSPGGLDAESELKFLIAEAGASYVLVHTGGDRPFILEGTAGVRYWKTESELIIKNGGTVLFDGDKKRDLVDPVVGLRASQYLTEKLHLDFAGDIGGFGISDDSSDLTWSATGLVSYDVADWFTISGGYKALALDAEEGRGATENGLDIVMHGALLVAKLKF